MPELQTATYIVALVYMGLMLLILLVVLIEIVRIRHKIAQFEHNIKSKMNVAKSIPFIAKEAFMAAKRVKRNS